MRQWAAAIIVVVLLVPAVVAGASGGGASEETYEDYFDTASYSGSNGSLDWSGPWAEGGESDGPGSGASRVVSSGSCHDGMCLELRGGILSQPSIRRQADLSEFVDARLEFRTHLIPAPLLSAGRLFVEVREDGSGWSSVADFALLAEAGAHSGSVDISGYLGDDFEVRFRLGGQLLLADRVYIDDVKVIGSVPLPTTTSTTAPTSTTSTTSTTTPTTTSTSTPAGTSPTTTTPATGTATTSPAAPSRSPTTTVDSAAGPAETGTSTTIEPGPTTTEDEPDDDSSPAVTGIATPTGPIPSDPPTGNEADPTALTVPDGSGLRLSRVGLLADYSAGMMGDMGTSEIEVLGVSLEADFSMAVEAFQATRLWIAALALVIAAALVSGMDIRRSRKGFAGITGPDVGRGESGTGE